jgi:hypothetical protein
MAEAAIRISAPDVFSAFLLKVKLISVVEGDLEETADGCDLVIPDREDGQLSARVLDRVRLWQLEESVPFTLVQIDGVSYRLERNFGAIGIPPSAEAAREDA